MRLDAFDLEITADSMAQFAQLQDSPPYRPEEDCFFASTDNDFNVWDPLSLITPPLTPVEFNSHDKEIIKHFSRCVTEPNEHFARDAESPAILNDIMWNSQHKRPDSSMDIDLRFNINGTPLSFDQPIANTMVDTAELFSFSLLENSCDAHHEERGNLAAHESSDSEEEIDVVNVQPEIKTKHSEHQCTSLTRPTVLNNKMYRKEENSDSEGEIVRISHNDLERKRRNELRNRFNSLRESIPSLSHNEKAAKITILRKASELIPVLQKEERKLVNEREFQRKRNTELLKRLSKLSAIR